LRRWFYAIYHGFKNRHALATFLACPSKRVATLTELTAKRLDADNIAILVLDFDGVLAPHGAKVPIEAAQKWLQSLVNNLGEQRLAILTNKPIPARLAYFANQFPSLYIAHGVRKKPYPDGLLQVAEYKGVPIHRLALLDDRLLTGMLATCLAYCQGYYFTHPYRKVSKRPVVELFFSALRGMERFIFWFFK